MKSIVIVNAGTGGQASVILDACIANGVRVAGWLSSGDGARNPGENLERLGDVALLDSRAFVGAHEIIVGTGNGDFRRTLSLRALAQGGTLATVRHPSAIVSSMASIGAGT